MAVRYTSNNDDLGIDCVRAHAHTVQMQAVALVKEVQGTTVEHGCGGGVGRVGTQHFPPARHNQTANHERVCMVQKVHSNACVVLEFWNFGEPSPRVDGILGTSGDGSVAVGAVVAGVVAPVRLGSRAT